VSGEDVVVPFANAIGALAVKQVRESRHVPILLSYRARQMTGNGRKSFNKIRNLALLAVRICR
jgi:hypothetical protein